MIEPPETITCVECGGTASLTMSIPDDVEIEPGTPLVYRCADCLERFDVVMDPDPDDEG